MSRLLMLLSLSSCSAVFLCCPSCCLVFCYCPWCLVILSSLPPFIMLPVFLSCCLSKHLIVVLLVILGCLPWHLLVILPGLLLLSHVVILLFSFPYQVLFFSLLLLSLLSCIKLSVPLLDCPSCHLMSFSRSSSVVFPGMSLCLSVSMSSPSSHVVLPVISCHLSSIVVTLILLSAVFTVISCPPFSLLCCPLPPGHHHCLIISSLSLSYHVVLPIVPVVVPVPLF